MELKCRCSDLFFGRGATPTRAATTTTSTSTSSCALFFTLSPFGSTLGLNCLSLLLNGLEVGSLLDNLDDFGLGLFLELIKSRVQGIHVPDGDLVDLAAILAVVVGVAAK